MRPAGTTNDPPLPAAVHLALQDGQFIEAIKLLRTATGCDLKTAKTRLERVAADDPVLRERFAAHLREVRRKFVAAVLVVDAVFVGAALLWWFSR
ncbi:MAG: hypothetical protein KAX84_05710 [Burkholderiales bacterium]|nr:hypothetical protein [Burkholderiales bacterium]